ncbi:MAG: hypothetical protein HUJ56_07905 [Erysipelotrichaceae bacterium]|nr:hypothetical protein [Erysipelotrichaceae bacterium]
MAKKKAKKKRKVSTAAIVLIVGLLIILIPCGVFAWILLSASMKTGTPILGDRYNGNLDPAITSEQIKQIENSVGSLGGVDKCKVELTTGTMRVYVDANDGASEEELSSLADQAYDVVNSNASISTYFTRTEARKMYDLEIHAYNLSNYDSDGFNYIIKVKNSAMEGPNTQVVSRALDEELAQQLRDDVEAANNPQPQEEESGELTVGSSDGEMMDESQVSEEGNGEE